MERRLAPINNLLLTTEECLLCGKYDGWMTGIKEEEKEEEKALQFRASTEYKTHFVRSYLLGNRKGFVGLKTKKRKMKSKRQPIKNRHTEAFEHEGKSFFN